MTTSLTIVRRIKAAPEAVFAALVEPEKLRRWWGPDSGPVTLAEVDAREGGRFHVRFRTEDGSEHGSFGTFAEYDPPHRLAMSWEWEDDPGQVSRVEVSLRAISDGTELTFTHSRLADEASRRSHEEGWNGALDKLEAMFESAGDQARITVTALKWVPPFAAGQVRDHRVRWILNEVGWPYEVRLIDAPTQASDAYRSKQPFGQVPLIEEDGRLPMFETGAIVLDVATRANKLMPGDANGRAQVLTWVFAALNSVEPFLQNVAEVEYFLEDEEDKDKRRPLVMEMADKRLGELQEALAGKQWLVGESFTVADLMMASVLKIARRLDILGPFLGLVAYQDRCLDRKAYRKAVADQRNEIAEHAPEDMEYAKAKGGRDGQ